MSECNTFCLLVVKEPVTTDLYRIRSSDFPFSTAETCVVVVSDSFLQAIVHRCLYIVRYVSAKPRHADEWRDEAWRMIQERSDCTFFMITKRPERIKDHIPSVAYEWDHLTIAVTCENQWMAEKRLPLYLSLPLRHHSVMIEPMLSRVNLRPYFLEYPGVIESVSVGGESGPDARPCDYAWVLDVHMQCVENSAAFSYHQTGAKLIRNGKVYTIPREKQHEQAHKAKLDYDPASGLRSFLDMPGE